MGRSVVNYCMLQNKSLHSSYVVLKALIRLLPTKRGNITLGGPLYDLFDEDVSAA